MMYIKTGEKDGFLILNDEHGNRAYFEFMEMAVVNGREYAALVETATDDLIILEFHESKDGNESYTVIEDDNEFEQVAAVFETMFNED